MAWTRSMVKGAALTTLCTIAAIYGTLSLMWAQFGAVTERGDFVTMSVIIAVVWAAIGGVMGIFIVMILKKNEGR